MKVKELLDSPAKWTKHSNAEDEFRRSCSPTSKYAVRWCLVGAIELCYPDSHGLIEDRVRTALCGSIVAFNDSPTTTFKGVKKLIEKLDI